MFIVAVDFNRSSNGTLILHHYTLPFYKKITVWHSGSTYIRERWLAINMKMIASHYSISTYQIHGVGSAHCNQLGSDGGKVDATVPQLSRKNLKKIE
jgi:hypothetical protein